MAPSCDLAGSLREGGRQLTGTFAFVLAALLLLSSLLIHHPLGIPAIGEFTPAQLPAGPGGCLVERVAPRRASTPVCSPPGLASWALGYLFLGATGLLRTVLLLGAVPVGAVGAWRLAKPIGSAWASVASFAVYLAIPVPYNALAWGSWSGLLVYAISPWMLLALGRASGAAPFGPANADPDEPAASLQKWSPLSVILGSAWRSPWWPPSSPSWSVLVIGVAVALTVGSILCFRVVGLARMLLVAAGASGLALALHLPWSLDLVAGPSPWESIAGISSTSTPALSLG